MKVTLQSPVSRQTQKKTGNSGLITIVARKFSLSPEQALKIVQQFNLLTLSDLNGKLSEIENYLKSQAIEVKAEAV
jgi:hypothetical protein